jgi:hypothetical protein
MAMDSFYVPAPRRLTMLFINGCDFCPDRMCKKCGTREESESENNKLEVIGGDRLFGWQYCNCCIEKLKEAKEYHMIDTDLLQQFFGPHYKVKRTSGDTDVGNWKIWYCLRMDSSTLKDDYSSHRVIIKHVSEPITKEIILNVLLQWNDLTLQDFLSFLNK